VAGVGHSIGASTLLALSGAQMWLGPGRQVAVEPDARLSRPALLTAPIGFFQAPGALDAMHVPLQVWAGSEDTITLASHAVETVPDKVAFLKSYSVHVSNFLLHCEGGLAL